MKDKVREAMNEINNQCHKYLVDLIFQMLLNKLGSDAGSESSTRGDSKSPGPQQTRLPVPKENVSHPGENPDLSWALYGTSVYIIIIIIVNP